MLKGSVDMTKINAARRDWTREEIMLALELYCTIPSEELNTNNEQIVTLAKTIGRTENSVMLQDSEPQGVRSELYPRRASRIKSCAQDGPSCYQAVFKRPRGVVV